MMYENSWGEYDAFAGEVFMPFFSLYAQTIIQRTGVSYGQLMDLGSGGGHLGFALMDAGNFEHVTFADISTEQLNNAHARAQERGYFPEECSFVEVDAVDLHVFCDDSFDLVVSRGSMHFWSDPLQAIREIHRVLKPNGYAYLGGGIGTNYRLTKRVEGCMHARRDGEGHFPHGNQLADERRQARNQACRDYSDLFEELGCSYAVINSKAEGGWYIFCKDDHLEW